MRATVLAGILCLLWGRAAWPQPPDLGDFDGKWEGSIAVVGTTADVPGDLRVNDKLEIRLEITATAAKAFALRSSWEELLVRRVVRNGPNAIVIVDTRTEHGAETWALTITKRDATSMVMLVSRSIRPPGASLEEARPVGVQASGELRVAGDE